MRAPIAAVTLVLTILAGAGCGKDGASSPADGGADTRSPLDGGGSVSATWSSYCTQESARVMACGEMFSAASCAEQGVCMANVAVPEYIGPLTTCLLRRACDDNDDQCYTQAAEMGNGRATVRATTAACLDKFDTCVDSNVGIDFCANLGLSTDAFLREVDGCLSQACAPSDTCLQALLTRSGCD